MKRTEQERINTVCMIVYNQAMDEYRKGHTEWKRLRTCTAEVCGTDNYYILRSYNTIVAVLDKNSDRLYDVLRIVYGYTATSSQHICKFNEDYSAAKFCTQKIYRAR